AVNGVIQQHEHERSIVEYKLGEGDQSHGSQLNLAAARKGYERQRRMQTLRDAVAVYRERFERRTRGGATEHERLHADSVAHGRIAKRADEVRETAQQAMWKAENDVRMRVKDYAQ